ncbi:MAG TPA: MopE-related protein [Patescibacteria group bacterium]|nr:MopE-related protein [Patescibacteria group bacterium]
MKSKDNKTNRFSKLTIIFLLLVVVFAIEYLYLDKCLKFVLPRIVQKLEAGTLASALSGAAPVWSNSANTSQDFWFVGDFSGDGKDDLAFVKNVSISTQRWYVKLSTGTSFGAAAIWEADFGNLGDSWFVGDFTGDGKDDLALVRNVSSAAQRWYVLPSTGTEFGAAAIWEADFGNLGDKWFVGDFNADSRSDLALVKNISAGTQKWYTILSSGSDFGTAAIWAPDFGNLGDKWFAGDFNADSRSDLALVRNVSAGVQRWYISLSSGTSFLAPTIWAPDFGNLGDSWFVGDFNKDNRSDLVMVRNVSSIVKRWYIFYSNGVVFENLKIWAADFGNSRDVWYLGDFKGDNHDEISLVRVISTTSQRWYVLNTIIDADSDNYGSAGEGGNDCNDNNASIHPGVTETCSNGIDDNCSGLVDEGCSGQNKKVLSGMTDYPWYHGCTPTSGGNMIAYWDQFSQYQNLFIGDANVWNARTQAMVASQAFVDAGNTYVGHNPQSLADFMQTVGYLTYTSMAAPGLHDYAAWDDPALPSPLKEAYQNTATLKDIFYDNYTYDNFKSEIDADRPVMFSVFADSPDGVVGHSVVAFGYYVDQSNNQFYAVRDTWHNGLSWAPPGAFIDVDGIEWWIWREDGQGYRQDWDWSIDSANTFQLTQ